MDFLESITEVFIKLCEGKGRWSYTPRGIIRANQIGSKGFHDFKITRKIAERI